MANELSTVLQAKYSKKVNLTFGQVPSRLMSRVNKVITDGNTFNFQNLTSTTTSAGPALGNNHANGTIIHAAKAATLTTQYAPRYLNEHEYMQFSAKEDVQRAYADSAVFALGGWIDSQIVAAMDASNTDISTLTGNFTLAKLTEAVQKMNEVDAFEGKRTLIVGPHQISEALNIGEITSSDYEGLHKVQNGGIANVFGVDVVMSNKLNLTTTLRSCYLINNNAVGLAMDSEIKSTIDWIPSMSQYLVNAGVSAGAVVIDPTAVIEIKCDEA